MTSLSVYSLSLPAFRFFPRQIFILFSLLGCLSAIGPAQSAAELSGRITDTGNASIPAAQIIVWHRASNVRLSTRSNADGSYRLSRLAAGDYLVSIEANGFARSVYPIRLSGAEKLDVKLDVSSLSDGVVVTAANSPQSVDETSKSVNVIEASEIMQRGEYALAEALRLTPGMRVQQLGGPQALVAIKTRGLRNEDTAVTLDGMRFRDASSIAGDASAFLADLLFVNQNCLEVLRGSGSSLYGSNAIGGVINIVSDEGGGKPHGSWQAEGGQLGLFRVRGNVAGGWNNDRLVYNFGLAHLNITNGLDGDDDARNTSAQAFAKWNVTPAAALSARLFGNRVRMQLNDSPYNAPSANLPATGIIPAQALALDQQRLLEAGKTFSLGNATFIPGLNDPDYWRRAHTLAGMLRWQHALNSSLNYQISYQALSTARAFLDGPLGKRFEPQFNNRSDYDARVDTLQVRADWLAHRNNQLTVGYEFERENYDNPTTDENPNLTLRTNARTKITQRSQTFFAQNQMRWLGDRLQFSLAGRVQGFQLSRPQFFGGTPQYSNLAFEAPPTAVTGDGSLAYFFKATNTKIRAHVGNGYRAPSLYERFGTGFFGGSFSPYGDPRLRPDRSIAVDAGIDQTLLNGRMRASATYFYTRLQEVTMFDFSGFINPATDPFGRFGGYRNTGGGLARGAEFSVQAKATTTTDVAVSYTFTNSDQRQPSSVAGFIPVFGVSNHMLTAFANQRIGKRVNVTFDLFAASDYYVPFGFPSRAYQFAGPVKADLGASYTLPLANDHHVRFYGKFDNVLNRTYYENGFRTPKAMFIGGASYSF